MRLTCPNCGVEYEVPAGMVPAAGRHVQCTSCHTRWFVRGEARGAASEDQILTRLESWRPRPVPVPAPVPSEGPMLMPVPDPEPEVAETPEPEAVETEEIVAGIADSGTEAETPPVETPPQAQWPADPADRPSVTQPAPVADTTPPPPPVRPAPRLDLGGEPTKPAPAAPAPRRFGRGFLTAVVLALLALGAYLYRSPIADRVPAAGPALEAYGDYVDRARDEVAQRYGELRARAGI